MSMIFHKISDIFEESSFLYTIPYIDTLFKSYLEQQFNL